MNRKIFKDRLFNESFTRDGFVVLRSLLEPEGLCRLQEAFDQLHKHISLNTFFTSTHSEDEKYRREADAQIKGLLSGFGETYLDDYAALYGNFMIKPKGGTESICTLHQDWTFVDETYFRSLNLWIPLVDTGIANGCFHLVPGSHSYDWPVRGRKIPPVYNDVMQYIVDNHLVPVPLAAGDAVIFDSALLHYSPENLTNRTRVATSLMFYPKKSELIHYSYNLKEQVLEKYSVTVDFFVRYGTLETLPVSEKPVSKIPFKQEFISEADFNLLAAAYSNNLNQIHGAQHI